MKFDVCLIALYFFRRSDSRELEVLIFSVAFCYSTYKFHAFVCILEK